MDRIVCIGGGSGGHILPIIILHEHLKRTRPDIECVWIWERAWMDEAKAGEHSIRFIPIQGIKLRRHFSLRNLLQPYFFLRAIVESYRILSQLQPKAIFCKWGGVALPVGVCAWFMRIPLFVHESDTVPWLTNRVVGFFAKRVFLGFDSAKKYFSNTEVEVVGQWIDPIFLEYMREHPFSSLAWRTGETKVVVQCWGLGSTRIFKQLLSCIGEFPDIRFTVALWTLNEHFLLDFQKYPNVFVKKWFFHEELAQEYAESDIALVRAAANTLAEAELFWLKMIMVPLPIASFDHQRINAIEYVARNPQHVLLEESNLASLSDVLASCRWYKKAWYGAEGSSTALVRVTEALLWRPNHWEK